MDSEIESQIEEWGKSYSDILHILSKFGIDSCVGEGDFWLLDDNYGSAVHRIYVFNISFLKFPMAQEIMNLLREKYIGWSVMISLDIKDENGEAVPPEGIILYPTLIEEFWDKNLLKMKFMNQFTWEK